MIVNVNFKKVTKFAFILLLFLIVLYLGAECGFQTKYYLDLWKSDRAMKNFNESITEMFKGDTDGGATPEETFNLFVGALKNENIDLAVKYIVLDIERRQRYYDEFNKMKQEGKLKEYIEDWPKWEDWNQTKDDYADWESRAEVWYSETIDKPTKIYDKLLEKEIEVQPGKYVQQDIIFIKNQNNIWKIESL